MLETERFDRESDNDDRSAEAGHAAEVTQDPAEAGQGRTRQTPASKEAGGRGRGLFRRGRRAATRPAGPPVDDQGGGSAQQAGDQACLRLSRAAGQLGSAEQASGSGATASSQRAQFSQFGQRAQIGQRAARRGPGQDVGPAPRLNRRRWRQRSGSHPRCPRCHSYLSPPRQPLLRRSSHRW